jgi:two-component system CheB/CheR fusion protein
LHSNHRIIIFQPRKKHFTALSPRQVPFGEDAMTASSLGILVVDDDRDTADSLAMLLKMSGFPAEPAYDASAALRFARQCSPYLVFLDLAMPEVDGYKLAEQLSRLPRMRDAVLVCISGYAGLVYQKRARRVGFKHFLVKPIDPEAVVRLVEEIAQSRRTATGS